VIPADVLVERISTEWGPYYGGALATRRFSGPETGVEIIVTIVSETFDDMNLLTSNINMTNLPEDYVVLSVPTSTVLVSGRGVVSTILSGFTVDSVIYHADRNQWDVDCRYVADIPNTLTSPFLSKVRSQFTLDCSCFRVFLCRLHSKVRSRFTLDYSCFRV
jgi:hypothetical protein